MSTPDSELTGTEETPYDDSAATTMDLESGTGEDVPTDAAEDEPLFPHDAAVDLRARWEAVQTGFVDDPRAAVGDADALVRDVLDRLATTFEDQRKDLEGQWNDGEPDTEDLRSALRRYRDFFDRLIAL